MEKEELAQRLKLIEDELFYFNSQLISLKWIGLKNIPTREEISLLNKSLGDCIKKIRTIREAQE